jgi:hypothetical protein
MTTVAYVYKWTHIPTGKWYIGSRTKAGCHPHDGYYCSSKEVKPLIKQSPKEWEREILATGIPENMLALETKYLVDGNAKQDPMSFNRHNGDGKFTTLGRIEPDAIKQKRIEKLRGIKRSEEALKNLKASNQKKANDPNILKKLQVSKPKGHGAKVSAALLGVAKSPEHKAAMSAARKGVSTGPCTEDRRNAISKAQKGKPCNNPIVQCPHCGKSGPSGAMVRWHFDNCKERLNDI